MQSTPVPADADGNEQFLPTREVLQRYRVSDMSLHRWGKDPSSEFPAPIRIAKRRYWRLSHLVAWERARIGKSFGEIDLEVEQRAASGSREGA